MCPRIMRKQLQTAVYEKSLEEKMKLIQQYELAGVAEWKLGFERDDVWQIISSYIQ